MIPSSNPHPPANKPSLHWSTVGISKPRLLIMMIALLLVGGLSSYMILPRMEDSVLTSRAATISTRFPVADAAQVEALVTDRIEKAIREVEEIKEIRSQSRSGNSLVTIELRDDVYVPGPIWSRIRGKVEDSIGSLPAEASRPQFDELEVRAFAWIGALTWTHDSEPNYAILVGSQKIWKTEFANLVAPMMSNISAGQTKRSWSKSISRVWQALDFRRAMLPGRFVATTQGMRPGGSVLPMNQWPSRWRISWTRWKPSDNCRLKTMESKEALSSLAMWQRWIEQLQILPRSLVKSMADLR